VAGLGRYQDDRVVAGLGRYQDDRVVAGLGRYQDDRVLAGLRGEQLQLQQQMQKQGQEQNQKRVLRLTTPKLKKVWGPAGLNDFLWGFCGVGMRGMIAEFWNCA